MHSLKKITKENDQKMTKEQKTRFNIINGIVTGGNKRVQHHPIVRVKQVVSSFFTKIVHNMQEM